MKRILFAGLAASVLCIGSVHAEQPIQQIPSPLVSYTSVRDAWAVAGLPVYTPTLLPVGYAQKDIIVIDRSIAEIFYRNDAGKEILFRMAKGDADISGDSTVYEVNQVVQIGRQYIRVKGDATVTQVTALSDEERVREIARMASGDDVTEAALANAREMLAGAEKKKTDFPKKSKTKN